MTANATDVKNRFGEFMDAARREPVTIRKTGRDYVVMLSSEEYDRLSAIEDEYWGSLAQMAEKSGFVGPEVSMELFRAKTGG